MTPVHCQSARSTISMGGLSNSHLFLTVQDQGTSTCGSWTLPGLQIDAFSLCPYVAGREREEGRERDRAREKSEVVGVERTLASLPLLKKSLILSRGPQPHDCF